MFVCESECVDLFVLQLCVLYLMALRLLAVTFHHVCISVCVDSIGRSEVSMLLMSLVQHVQYSTYSAEL